MRKVRPHWLGLVAAGAFIGLWGLAASAIAGSLPQPIMFIRFEPNEMMTIVVTRINVALERSSKQDVHPVHVDGA